MAQYDNTNRGAIWKNEKKETDKHPDFTGSINVDGHDYWLSGWRRAGGADPKSPAMRFQVKRKDGKPSPTSRENKTARPSLKDDMDGDSIPF